MTPRGHVRRVFEREGSGADAIANRSRERYRRLGMSFVAGVGSRAVTFGGSFVSIPIAVGYLGAGDYGLVATILSLTAFAGLSDLGLGNGVVAGIARAKGRDDTLGQQRLVSTAFYVLVAASLVIGVVVAVSFRFVPWASALGAQGDAREHAATAVAVFVGLTVAATPLAVAQRVHIGLQEAFVPSVWQAVATIASVSAVAAVAALNLGFVAIVAALVGAPAAAAAINFVYTFGKAHKPLAPRIERFDRETAAVVLRVGGAFFVIQGCVAAAFESDALILAHVTGAKSVTTYWVTTRIFSVAPILLTFVVAPLWPAYGEAIARGDVVWVERTLRRTLAAAAGVAVPTSLLLLAVGRPLIHLWVSDVRPPILLVAALALWSTMMCVSGTIAAFLNGVRAFRFQVVTAVAMTLVNVPLSIGLARGVGVSGVVWGSVIAQATCVLVPSAIFIPSALRRLIPALDG